MYKCYACGREIENPEDACPYCRFPVISTLHGEADEEEAIRQFAEEYRKTNPQYFPKILPNQPNSPKQEATRDEKPLHDASQAQTNQVQVQQDLERLKRQQNLALLRKENERKEQEERRKQEQALHEVTEKTVKKKSRGFVILLVLLLAGAGIYLFITQLLPRLQQTKTAANISTSTESRTEAAVTSTEPATSEKAPETTAQDISTDETETEPEETEAPDPFLSALSEAEPGDVITFGSYEQDGNSANGKEAIEWLVLQKTEDRVLVISNYVLDSQKFHNSSKNALWESCALREWLNDTFLKDAFSEDELKYIPEAAVTADKNPNYDSDPGSDTRDRVFLLSILEAEKCFSSDAARRGLPTAYTISKGVNVSKDGYCWWWLRTPGASSARIACVNASGSAFSGSPCTSQDRGVRPALWISLEP